MAGSGLPSARGKGAAAANATENRRIRRSEVVDLRELLGGVVPGGEAPGGVRADPPGEVACRAREAAGERLGPHGKGQGGATAAGLGLDRRAGGLQQRLFQPPHWLHTCARQQLLREDLAKRLEVGLGTQRSKLWEQR